MITKTSLFVKSYRSWKVNGCSKYMTARMPISLYVSHNIYHSNVSGNQLSLNITPLPLWC